MQMRLEHAIDAVKTLIQIIMEMMYYATNANGNGDASKLY